MSGQRSKSSLFALPVTGMGLITAASPNFQMLPDCQMLLEGGRRDHSFFLTKALSEHSDIAGLWDIGQGGGNKTRR